MSNKNENNNTTVPAVKSQQDSTPTIGGGHPAATQVLPGGKVINTSLSVSGQLPVVNR